MQEGVRGESPEVAGCLHDAQVKLETGSIDSLPVSIQFFIFISLSHVFPFLFLSRGDLSADVIIISW